MQFFTSKFQVRFDWNLFLSVREKGVDSRFIPIVPSVFIRVVEMIREEKNI